MTIAGFSAEAAATIIRENLTPSKEISDPSRLFGRERILKQIERAFNSQGRAVFIHGDRGVGKSSVAVTAAKLRSSEFVEPIRVVCGEADTFGSVLQSIGKKALDVRALFTKQSDPAQLGFSFAGYGVHLKGRKSEDHDIPAPATPNQALEIINFCLTKINGDFVIIIDEMDRISSPLERERFAEFIKNIPGLDDRVKFIFCGIGQTQDELLGAHPSAGRVLESIKVDRLHHDQLWKIIEHAASKLSIEIEREALIRISQISDGFPSYVHLIGDSLFWSIFDDAELVSKARERHFRAGIDGAIERSEATLKATYDKATLKTKNKLDYEEALWALADKTSDRRQVTEIYDSSYRPMMLKRTGRLALSKVRLNSKFNRLKTPNHGGVIVPYGSGWFGFRENIMRGYVRLKAESAGIQLGRDNHMISR